MGCFDIADSSIPPYGTHTENPVRDGVIFAQRYPMGLGTVRQDIAGCPAAEMGENSSNRKYQDEEQRIPYGRSAKNQRNYQQTADCRDAISRPP